MVTNQKVIAHQFFSEMFYHNVMKVHLEMINVCRY